MDQATFNDFLKIDIRVGKIIAVDDFPEAKKPMYKFTIDFGEEIGLKKSCGQYTQNYTKSELTNKRILGVVNFPPRQIGPAISEVLTVGVYDDNGNAIMVVPDKDSPLGARLG